ncbi:hypothetical protein N0V95_000532 [Ascochyta clinopodiicola]|nr:hypothetical protein N0V95_000532 [Ascochyta clinopodiicola]
MSAPRNPSPTRQDTVIADRKRLNEYNITRSREEEPSPHAQAIVDRRRAASAANEITARKMLEEHILFRSECSPGGIKGLTLIDQVDLVKDFLPKPPRPTVPSLWGSLARPQPDSCIGYVTATEAKSHTPALSMPFTRMQGDIADWFNIVHNADAHFPFLTAQWKAPTSGEGQTHVSVQAARDGAIIVNYMHQFYTLAYPGRDPTAMETCHMSLTTEGYTIVLWIHWRETNTEDDEVYWRMEELDTARMNKLDDLRHMRNMLHNYLDNAMEERLSSIKEALPAFWSHRPKKRVNSTRSQSSAAETDLQLDIPLTPSTSATMSADGDLDPRKRRRTWSHESSSHLAARVRTAHGIKSTTRNTTRFDMFEVARRPQTARLAGGLRLSQWVAETLHAWRLEKLRAGMQHQIVFPD